VFKFKGKQKLTGKLEIRPEIEETIANLVSASRQASKVMIDSFETEVLSEAGTQKVVDKFLEALDSELKGGPQDMALLLGASEAMVEDILEPHYRQMMAIQYRALPQLQKLTLDEYICYAKQIQEVTKETLVAINPLIEKIIMTQVFPKLITQDNLIQSLGLGSELASHLGVTMPADEDGSDEPLESSAIDSDDSVVDPDNTDS
tara:strand:+ start:457 stop:1068 length:612 start_codon:yes stop_codon:yes gene_type:complete